MKRKIIALLLAIILFVAPQVNVTNSSAKTEKYPYISRAQVPKICLMRQERHSVIAL